MPHRSPRIWGADIPPDVESDEPILLTRATLDRALDEFPSEDGASPGPAGADAQDTPADVFASEHRDEEALEGRPWHTYPVSSARAGAIVVRDVGVLPARRSKPPSRRVSGLVIAASAVLSLALAVLIVLKLMGGGAPLADTSARVATPETPIVESSGPAATVNPSADRIVQPPPAASTLAPAPARGATVPQPPARPTSNLGAVLIGSLSPEPAAKVTSPTTETRPALTAPAAPKPA